MIIHIDAPAIILTGTLAAGNTEITFTDSAIKQNSTFDIYNDIYGVSATAIEVTDGSIKLTYEALDTDLSIKVKVG